MTQTKPWITLSLHRGTVLRLKEVGRFGESWDALLNRLMDEREGK